MLFPIFSGFVTNWLAIFLCLLPNSKTNIMGFSMLVPYLHAPMFESINYYYYELKLKDFKQGLLKLLVQTYMYQKY